MTKIATTYIILRNGLVLRDVFKLIENNCGLTLRREGGMEKSDIIRDAVRRNYRISRLELGNKIYDCKSVDI